MQSVANDIKPLTDFVVTDDPRIKPVLSRIINTAQQLHSKSKAYFEFTDFVNAGIEGALQAAGTHQSVWKSAQRSMYKLLNTRWTNVTLLWDSSLIDDNMCYDPWWDLNRRLDLHTMMMCLTPKQYAAINMLYLQGMKNKDADRKAGVAPTTVHARASVGIRRIRRTYIKDTI